MTHKICKGNYFIHHPECVHGYTMNALTKVETSMMERYETKCCHCGWVLHFFGMEKEARSLALKMGWEFLEMRMPPRSFTVNSVPCVHENPTKEVALCPHCKILTKETPCPPTDAS